MWMGILYFATLALELGTMTPWLDSWCVQYGIKAQETRVEHKIELFFQFVECSKWSLLNVYSKNMNLAWSSTLYLFCLPLEKDTNKDARQSWSLFCYTSRSFCLMNKIVVNKLHSSNSVAHIICFCIIQLRVSLSQLRAVCFMSKWTRNAFFSFLFMYT